MVEHVSTSLVSLWWQDTAPTPMLASPHNLASAASSAMREQDCQAASLLQSGAALTCTQKVLPSAEGPGSGTSAEGQVDSVEGR